MIRAYYFKENGELITDLSPAGYPAALQDPQGLLWIDFTSEAPEVCEPILRETFGATLGRRRVDAKLENSVLQGIFDHYYEKMLSAYWGYERFIRTCESRIGSCFRPEFPHPLGQRGQVLIPPRGSR